MALWRNGTLQKHGVEMIGTHGLSGGRWGSRDIPSHEEIERNLITPCAERIFYIRHVFRAGFGLDAIHRLTKIDPWFLRNIREIVDMQEQLAAAGNQARLVL
jgi:carbamoyl-phosphate synthase large subunit